MSHCSNNYILEYVLPNHPWYERDGFMTWYDQVKYEDFLKNCKQHFEDTKIINFHYTRREARGETVPDGGLKNIRPYRTVNLSIQKKTAIIFCPLHFAPRDLISV